MARSSLVLGTYDKFPMKLAFTGTYLSPTDIHAARASSEDSTHARALRPYDEFTTFKFADSEAISADPNQVSPVSAMLCCIGSDMMGNASEGSVDNTAEESAKR
jgi:hypothetical protein